jgi:5-methylcytosine-specific restriction protein A
MALKKFCAKNGCRELVDAKYCSKHLEEDIAYESNRGSAAKRGYDSQWRKARVYFLIKHPLCVHCEKEGTIGAAMVVDHIKPHKGDKDLFWDRNNWQPLCKRHHDIKTVTEDGGFGR